MMYDQREVEFIPKIDKKSKGSERLFVKGNIGRLLKVRHGCAPTCNGKMIAKNII